VQLLIFDWGLEPLDAAARHDLLEILEEPYGRRSTAKSPSTTMARPGDPEPEPADWNHAHFWIGFAIHFMGQPTASLLDTSPTLPIRSG